MGISPRRHVVLLVSCLAVQTVGAFPAWGLSGQSSAEAYGRTPISPFQAVAIPVQVAPAVELFSIIHRLAGTGQYDEMQLPGYVQDVWDHFGSFQGHAAVTLAQEMNREHAINGNAPMDLAVHVTEPPELELRSTMVLVLEDLDSRWSAEIIPPFLEAARQFALDTDFQAFFVGHQSFYDAAISSLKATLAGTDLLPWFQGFFGGAPEDYTIVLGLLNGTCNYGSRVTFPAGEQEFVSMLGGRDPDPDGVPVYSRERFIPTIVHEFNHSYVNPLVDRNREQLKPVAEPLFSAMEEDLRHWGYDHWYVMIYEYLVRAATLRHLEVSEGAAAATAHARQDVRAGFVGVAELADLLEEYENNRAAYSVLDDFMPRLVEFFRELGSRQ